MEHDSPHLSTPQQIQPRKDQESSPEFEDPSNVERVKDVLHANRKIRWNIIGRCDWRIFLPIGIVILIRSALSNTYPSTIGHVGIICFAIGAANLGARLFFKQHLPYNQQAPESTKQGAIGRFRIELWIMIGVAIAVVIVAIVTSRA